MWSKSFGSFESFASFGPFAFVAALALASPVHAQSALADRIQAGDRRAALEMIAKGADVNAAQADGTTPLHWAIDDEAKVRLLLSRRANVNAKQVEGR